MTERFATTPFGGRSLSRGMFSVQESTALARARLAKTHNSSKGESCSAPDKWRLLRALTEARSAYGLSDRTIAVLEALVSFQPGTTLDASKAVIVFPSNAELSLRTRGMAPATLRRHLAILVETGLIIRRDSPNGKRYARRDEQGLVETAYGFDLSPLALRQSEIETHAHEARALAHRIGTLRTEITIHLRDISKTIEAGLAEGRKGPWAAFQERLASLSGRVARNASEEAQTARRDALVRLRAEIENTYLDTLTEQEMSANESVFERHIQSSDSEPNMNKCKENNLKENPPQKPEPEKPRNGQFVPKTKPIGPNLGTVLKICPQFSAYSRSGIRDWMEFLRTAGLVHTMLGISPDAWKKARNAMGDVNAAVTVAAILERAGDIHSPGGYLRSLTKRAELGLYSTTPVLNALRKTAITAGS